MSVLKFIVTILLTLGFSIWRQWMDAYHLVVVIPVSLVVLILLVIRERKMNEERDLNPTGDEPGPVGTLAAGVFWAIILGFILSIALWIADMTPLDSLFLDQDRAKVEHDLHLFQSADAWSKYEERVRQQLDQKISKEWRRELEVLVYQAIIEQARRAQTSEEKVAQYERAKQWAIDHEIDPSLAAAEGKLAQPTPTPRPTATPVPTATPTRTQTPTVTSRPTQTATPTETPMPKPTQPALFVDCVIYQGDAPVDVVQSAKDELLLLWGCRNDKTLFKNEWQIAAQSEGDVPHSFSALIRESDPKGAVWYRSSSNWIRVTVIGGKMQISYSK